MVCGEAVCIAKRTDLVATEQIHWSEASWREPEQPAAPSCRSPTWKDCECPDQCADCWWHRWSHWDAERISSAVNWMPKPHYFFINWNAETLQLYEIKHWDSSTSKMWQNICMKFNSDRDSILLLKNKKQLGHFKENLWESSLYNNAPFGSPQFLFSFLALRQPLSVICGNSKTHTLTVSFYHFPG